MAATQPTPPTGQLGLADSLVQLAHLVDRVFAKVSRDHDLTPQQVQLICMLIDGPVGMGELGRLLHLEKSSMSGLVDRVSRRGLVERVPDQQDRRACRIALTPDGRRTGRRTHEQVVAQLETAASALSAGERRSLVTIIGTLAATNRTEDG